MSSKRGEKRRANSIRDQREQFDESDSDIEKMLTQPISIHSTWAAHLSNYRYLTVHTVTA